MDNVFIFGAGTSADAGIPLLGRFVESMWEIAVRRMIGGKEISKEDEATFSNFLKVIHDLDGYHGRANFDDRNIEDILSILTFNQYEKTRSASDSIKSVVNAISRTIELRCTIKTISEGTRYDVKEHDIYQDFWRGLLSYSRIRNEMPVIITLNYDLVLERSLLGLFNSRSTRVVSPWQEFKTLGIRYHHKMVGDHYRLVRPVLFNDGIEGTVTKEIRVEDTQRSGPMVDIHLLKLHGSLNFPKRKEDQTGSILESRGDPDIIPPVFDKRLDKTSSEVWAFALEALRSAKNIIFVGYSLPLTDIYMQYFIRTAIGPNQDLNYIHIFDPAVQDRSSDTAKEYQRRYETCFSPQLHKRIIYNNGGRGDGTFANFVNILKDRPNDILF